MMPLLAVFCTLHCCPEWIKHRGSNLSPLGSCSIRVLCKEGVQDKLHVKDPHKRHSHHHEKCQNRPQTPPHCCYLTFITTAMQLPVHSQAFVVGLFGHILAFGRCQSAKTEVAIANHTLFSAEHNRKAYGSTA